MDKRDWIWLSVTIILFIIVIVSNIEVREQEVRKDKTERLLSICENWEICDYKINPYCLSTECPETYQCWWEQRNCEPQTQANSIYDG